MSYITNSTANRLKINKGWKNPSFPETLPLYSRDSVFFFKLYLFLKAYFTLNRTRLVYCDLRTSENYTKIIYLVINSVPKKFKKKNSYRTWYVRKPTSGLQHSTFRNAHFQQAFNLAYLDLPKLKKMVSARLLPLSKQKLNPAFYNKTRYKTWINFLAKIQTLRTKTALHTKRKSLRFTPISNKTLNLEQSFKFKLKRIKNEVIVLNRVFSTLKKNKALTKHTVLFYKQQLNALKTKLKSLLKSVAKYKTLVRSSSLRLTEKSLRSKVKKSNIVKVRNRSIKNKNILNRRTQRKIIRRLKDKTKKGLILAFSKSLLLRKKKFLRLKSKVKANTNAKAIKKTKAKWSNKYKNNVHLMIANRIWKGNTKISIQNYQNWVKKSTMSRIKKTHFLLELKARTKTRWISETTTAININNNPIVKREKARAKAKLKLKAKAKASKSGFLGRLSKNKTFTSQFREVETRVNAKAKAKAKTKWKAKATAKAKTKWKAKVKAKVKTKGKAKGNIRFRKNKLHNIILNDNIHKQFVYNTLSVYTDYLKQNNYLNTERSFAKFFEALTAQRFISTPIGVKTMFGRELVKNKFKFFAKKKLLNQFKNTLSYPRRFKRVTILYKKRRRRGGRSKFRFALLRKIRIRKRRANATRSFFKNNSKITVDTRIVSNLVKFFEKNINKRIKAKQKEKKKEVRKVRKNALAKVNIWKLRESFRNNSKTHTRILTKYQYKLALQQVLFNYFKMNFDVKIVRPLAQFKNLKFLRLAYPLYRHNTSKKITLKKTFRKLNKEVMNKKKYMMPIKQRYIVMGNRTKRFAKFHNRSVKNKRKNTYISRKDADKFKRARRQELLNFTKVRLTDVRKSLIMRSFTPIASLFLKYLNPQILADHIAKEFEKTKHHKSIIYSLSTALRALPASRIKGYHISIVGRINSSEKSRTFLIKRNVLCRQDFSRKVNFASSQARARIGSFGINVWVFY